MYKIGEVLVKKPELNKMLIRISDEINRDYAGQEIVMIGIFKGAMVFLADLMRLIKVPVTMDFLVVSSYGVETESSGVVLVSRDIDTDIEGKHVILVEDLIDTGATLKYLKNMLGSRNPASLKICAAFDKPSRRKVEMEADYLGITIPDKFVIGYGLDFAERYRQIPELCVLVETEA
ncbi:MAG: hypoxanthine phosphoribosyltransferase [Oscillospiraceae bacterium]|nr:hypoxanthine phosphoribosyltransferase [Oscillospiraceae bacterium]